jgi:hypothetical protein
MGPSPSTTRSTFVGNSHNRASPRLLRVPAAGPHRHRCRDHDRDGHRRPLRLTGRALSTRPAWRGCGSCDDGGPVPRRLGARGPTLVPAPVAWGFQPAGIRADLHSAGSAVGSHSRPRCTAPFEQSRFQGCMAVRKKGVPCPFAGCAAGLSSNRSRKRGHSRVRRRVCAALAPLGLRDVTLGRRRD